MAAYILRRLLATIPVMAVVAVFVFFLLRLAPGDPAAIIAGEDATAEGIAAVRAKLGLDRPVLEQFAVWLFGLAQGDLGTSIFSNLPVTRLIAQRIEPTLALTVSTLLVAVCLAIPIGVLAAWKARTWIDRAVMVFVVMGFSMPAFLVGYVLIYIFAIRLGWLPVQGYRPLTEGFLPFAEGLVLPSLTLGIAYMALIARITRASMLEVLSQDYIRTANSKGLDTQARADGARAQERLGADRHRHRHRHRAPHLGRRHHRDSVQHPGPRPADRGCGPQARLPDRAGAHHRVRRRQGSGQPSDRPVLRPPRPAHQVLAVSVVAQELTVAPSPSLSLRGLKDAIRRNPTIFVGADAARARW